MTDAFDELDLRPAPQRSNCYLWARCMRHLFGGDIKWRWSKNYPGPHFYWISPDGSGAWGYSPTRPLWPIPWNILWFKGVVKPEKGVIQAAHE